MNELLTVVLCICAWDNRHLGWQAALGFLIAACLAATLARHGA